jgi:hypothetical protein
MVTKTLHCPTRSQLNEASHHRLVFTVRGDRGVMQWSHLTASHLKLLLYYTDSNGSA